MLEAALGSHQLVNIAVVNGNLIQCGTKGGNLRVKSKIPGPPPRESLTITWRWIGDPANTPFRLQFFAVPLEEDNAPAPYWPFSEPAPPGGLTDLRVEHIYTVLDINVICKYSVLVDNLHLDPIIIVEK